MPLLFCRRSFDCIHLRPFLGSPFDFLHLSVYAFTRTTLFGLLLLYSKCWNRTVSVLQLCSSPSILCWLFWVCLSIYTLKLVCWYPQNNLLRFCLTLNIKIKLGRMDMLTILSLPIHKHRIFIYLVIWFCCLEFCEFSRIDLVQISLGAYLTTSFLSLTQPCRVRHTNETTISNFFFCVLLEEARAVKLYLREKPQNWVIWHSGTSYCFQYTISNQLFCITVFKFSFWQALQL